MLDYLKQSIGVEFNNDELLQFLKVFELDKNGRLFQFIFEPEIAEELVYSSYAVGRVSLVQIPGYQPGYYGAFGFIKTARENLEALNQALLNDQKDLNSLQFRIFAHPQKILDPSLVRVKSYWGNSIDAEKLKAYNKKLRIFTQEIILKFLKNKMQISKGVLTTVDQSSDNLTPIQRLEKYVQEGTTGEELQLKSITSSLAQAIYHQDIRLVEKILSQTKYMDLMKEIEYFTPAGASIKFSPFFHIFKNKNFQMLNILERYLLQAGKNVGDEFLRAAKNFRINYEQESADAKVSAIQLALEKGANANLADEKGVPYIVHFCNEAYDMYDTPFKIVKLLLKYNADIDAKDKEGVSPLLAAYNSYNMPLFQYLLENGANPNTKIVGGLTLLARMIRSSDNLTKFMIEKGADPNVNDVNGNPIIFNVEDDILEVLLNAKVNTLTFNTIGYTPLTYAVFLGNLDRVKLLIKKGQMDPNLKDKQNVPKFPLEVALIRGELFRNSMVSIFEYLLENGADPNVSSFFGEFLILIAARKKDINYMKILLEKKANPNVFDFYDGYTPLLKAIKNNEEEKVKLLLEFKADVTLKSNMPPYISPIELAMQKGNSRIIELLKK